jgi:hypothetical protein
MRAFLFGVVLLLSSCGSPERACVPGATRDCRCLGGAVGVQVCDDSGERFGACDCGPGPTDDAGTTETDTGTLVMDDAGALEDASADAATGPIDCATVPPPAGWRRGLPTRFTEVPWIEIVGAFWNPFPNGGGTGRLLTSDDEYLAIEFDTPVDEAGWSMAPNRRFSWDRSQVGGEADIVYIGLGTCPGDFRIPATDAVAPPGDPTFASGCRSVRRTVPGGPVGPTSNIPYVISDLPSDGSTCRLAYGRRYYLNIIRADATDGAIGTPAVESVCVNPDLTTCGIQMRVD